MKSPFIRSPYNYDLAEASDAAAYVPVGPSLTVQSQSEDADINVLMKRFGITGKFPENPLVPQYGDFSQIKDFRSAWDACAAAADAFMQYPADFRARFDNDPQLFLDFAENPVNIPEMRKLGLFKESTNVNGTGSGSGASPQGSSAGGASSSSDGGQAGGANSSSQSGGSSGQVGSASAVR